MRPGANEHLIVLFPRFFFFWLLFFLSGCFLLCAVPLAPIDVPDPLSSLPLSLSLFFFSEPEPLFYKDVGSSLVWFNSPEFL